jgi:hypothetical protein
MKALRVSSLHSHDVFNSIFFYLLKKYSKSPIEITNPARADVLFIGPYDHQTIKKKFFSRLKKNKIIKRFSSSINFIKTLRRYQPIKIYFSVEAYINQDDLDKDYHITPHFGVDRDNHLRFPPWKENVDWSSFGIERASNCLNGLRFGKLYDIEHLTSPQGEDFLKKNNKICFFSSHLDEPRKSIYDILSKNFVIDGFGRYFDNTILNHNSSKFLKYEVMKNYRFNLCPHNVLCSGHYDEKIPDAFIGKTLPITWCDSNVQEDFNSQAFLNLYNYSKSNYKEVASMLNDVEYLKKFSKEPLVVKKLDLNLESAFVQKILKNF